MKILGLDHLNLSINDLDKSLKFYKNLFGFELKEEGISGGQRWAILGISDTLMLALYESKEKHTYAGFNHFGLVVDHLEEFLLKANKENVKVELLIDYPKSKSAYIKDPDGIEIEISSKFGGGL